MKLPRKFEGKKMGEIDSHDFCISMIEAHKKMRVHGNVSVTTCEEGKSPCLFVHYNGVCFMLECYTNSTAENVWKEYINRLEHIKTISQGKGGDNGK